MPRLLSHLRSHVTGYLADGRGGGEETVACNVTNTDFVVEQPAINQIDFR